MRTSAGCAVGFNQDIVPRGAKFNKPSSWVSNEPTPFLLPLAIICITLGAFDKCSITRAITPDDAEALVTPLLLDLTRFSQSTFTPPIAVKIDNDDALSNTLKIYQRSGSDSCIIPNSVSPHAVNKKIVQNDMYFTKFDNIVYVHHIEDKIEKDDSSISKDENKFFLSTTLFCTK